MTSLPHVDETLALATREIVPRLMPQGFTLCDPSPNSLEECTRFFQSNGKIGVHPGFDETSIFADAETTHAFQAWHDWCHVKGQCTFDIPGERRVDEIMQQHLARWWATSRRPVAQPAFERASTTLKMFNLGRLEYWLVYGKAPENPREFLFGYLTANHRITIPDLCGDTSALILDGNEWTHYVR